MRISRRKKNLLLFNDNSSCRVNCKHHYSGKNLSNSQLNSVTNSRTSRNLSGEGADSDDFDDNESGRAPASDVGVIRTSSNRNLQTEPRNSFYCISLGNIAAEHYVSARPSFYSDPTRQYDCDAHQSFKSDG